MTLDQLNLKKFKEAFGEMSSAEALEFALFFEGVSKAMRPFDTAKASFMRHQQAFETYALLLEREKRGDLTLAPRCGRM